MKLRGGQPFILPREAGEGDRPKGGGRGLGLTVTQASHVFIGIRAVCFFLQRQRSFASEAPSTTLRVVPLPRFAGADAIGSSREVPSFFRNTLSNSLFYRLMGTILTTQGMAG